MAVVQSRYFGKPKPAARIAVYEKPSINQIPDPLFGTTAVIGNAKRGPMGVFTPARTLQQYLDVYGDPQERRWHLFANSAHLLPDFVDEYFGNSSGSGTLFVGRLQLDNARRAEVVLKNRMGAPVLRIRAANEGRWGGAQNAIPATGIVVASARTFTLIVPGALANEFVDAEVSFSGVPGKTYRVISNTAAHSASGETVFTVGAQYNLLEDGVSGPAALTGTASYTTRTNLTGTVAFALYKDLAGTIAVNDNVLTGTGTAFLTELTVGKNIYKDGVARVIDSVTSDTTATISAPFPTEGDGLVLQVDNLQLVGTGTTFTTALSVGDRVYATIDDQLQFRTVAAIASDLLLTLTSGFTEALTPATIVQRDNRTVTGVGTQFTTQLSPGVFLIDPNRSGALVKVVSIESATSATVEKVFSQNFAAAQLTKQSQLATVTLNANRTDGLAVKVVQGQRQPETHFGLRVYFNGAEVLNIGDASLDASDPDFVENVVDQANIAFSSGSTNYHTWITAENLWTSDYTTNPGNDVRPCNGAGQILELTNARLYTIADLEYDYLAGETLYPNPYEFPRSFFRVQTAIAPLDLAGTISSSGVNVTGTSTTFRTDLKAGDYLYDSNSRTVRKVNRITSDTALVLETAFPSNVPALTKAKRSGYLQVNDAYDLMLQSAVGDYFLVVHPQILAKGYDGNTAAINPVTYDRFLSGDLNLLEKTVINKNLGLVRIACPGISDVAIQKAAVNLAELRAFEFRVEIPSYLTTASSAEAWVQQQLGRNDFETVTFPSYGYKANPLGRGYRFVPLSGAIMGGESRRANANNGWHYPYAGTEATLPSILKLPVVLEPADEAILNGAGIQPVLFVDGNAVVFGARTPSLTETYKFTHIRRIQSHYVRVLLEARNLMSMLFLPNQPGVVDQIILMLEQFARREYDRGVLSQYLSFRQAASIDSTFSAETVVTDESAQNSMVSIINGELTVSFFYAPTGILEVLNIIVGPQVLVERYGENN